MAKKVGVTGMRTPTNYEQREWTTKILTELYEPGAELHHGDCKGFDTLCHEIAKEIGYRVVKHPADVNPWSAHNEGADEVWPMKPPLLRNKDIANVSDVGVACPSTAKRKLRSGTWATVRYFEAQGKKVINYWERDKNE